MSTEVFEPRTIMMSERAIEIINTIAINKGRGLSFALDLIIKEWFDNQEEEYEKNESKNLDLRVLKEKLISIDVIVNGILEDLESDRK